MLAFLPLANRLRLREGVRMTAAEALDRDAIAHFSARLRYETDPSDVAAARAAGAQLVLVDVRSQVSWDQGHIPGARHLPLAELEDRLGELPAPQDDPHLVVYCWGPGCNGSTRGALTLARAGYRQVQEMIGGFEYWAREGLAFETAAGRSRRPVDPLAAPVPPAVR
jgi:rhodanese-related sulfurtransferase